LFEKQNIGRRLRFGSKAGLGGCAESDARNQQKGEEFLHIGYLFNCFKNTFLTP
jgi:hypothetical protein